MTLKIARLYSILLLLTGLIFIHGCSSWFGGEDNSIPPTPLSSIDEKVSLEPLWEDDAGTGLDEFVVKLAPALSESNIYVASRDGQVKAYERLSGQILWNIQLEQKLTGGVGYHDGQLYVGTTQGELQVLNAEDGSLKWKKNLSSIILSVPVAFGDVLVVRTLDGKLYGLNSGDGVQLWVYDRGVPVLTLRGNSTPVIGGGELVFTGFDSGKVAAVGLQNGRLLWESRVAVPRGRSDLERLVDIDGDPLLMGRILYAVSFHGRLVAIDAIEGEIIWSRDMSSYAGMGADNRYLFVTDDTSNVWAVDLKDGDSLWKQDKLAYRKLTAPTAIDDYIVVGDLDGYLHVLSRVDGSLLGREQIDSKGISIQPLVKDNTIYVYGNSGIVAALTLN